jgi:hypothetical protein
VSITVEVKCDGCGTPLELARPREASALVRTLNSFVSAQPPGGERRHGEDGHGLYHACYSCIAGGLTGFTKAGGASWDLTPSYVAAAVAELKARGVTWRPRKCPLPTDEALARFEAQKAQHEALNPPQLPPADRSWQQPGAEAEWRPPPGGPSCLRVELVQKLGPDTWAIRAPGLPGPAWAHAGNLAPVPPPQVKEAPPDGARLIAEERRRQVAVEGYDADHDAAHRRAELAWAAACYAAPGAVYRMSQSAGAIAFVDPWPGGWPDKRERPAETEGRLRELVKAGALVAAELDRLMALVAARDGTIPDLWGGTIERAMADAEKTLEREANEAVAAGDLALAARLRARIVELGKMKKAGDA